MGAASRREAKRTSTTLAEAERRASDRNARLHSTSSSPWPAQSRPISRIPSTPARPAPKVDAARGCTSRAGGIAPDPVAKALKLRLFSGRPPFGGRRAGGENGRTLRRGRKTFSTAGRPSRLPPRRQPARPRQQLMGPAELGVALDAGAPVRLVLAASEPNPRDGGGCDGRAGGGEPRSRDSHAPVGRYSPCARLSLPDEKCEDEVEHPRGVGEHGRCLANLP
jgi:hypothetical protein